MTLQNNYRNMSIEKFDWFSVDTKTNIVYDSEWERLWKVVTNPAIQREINKYWEVIEKWEKKSKKLKK
jgi:hypothetical protein